MFGHEQETCCWWWVLNYFTIHNSNCYNINRILWIKNYVSNHCIETALFLYGRKLHSKPSEIGFRTRIQRKPLHFLFLHKRVTALSLRSNLVCYSQTKAKNLDIGCPTLLHIMGISGLVYEPNLIVSRKVNLSQRSVSCPYAIFGHDPRHRFQISYKSGTNPSLWHHQSSISYAHAAALTICIRCLYYKWNMFKMFSACSLSKPDW